jgi:integrase
MLSRPPRADSGRETSRTPSGSGRVPGSVFFLNEVTSRARKRRGRGEGAVFERDDGQWVGSISLGYAESGKRKRKTVCGATKQEVLNKLDELRGDARAGNLPDAGKLTIGQLLDRWLQSNKPKMGVRTYEEREKTVTNHIRPHLGGVKLSKLSAMHVEAFYADLHNRSVGAWAIRHACRLKLIPRNPAAAVPKPKEPKREMMCLTQAQAKHFIAAARWRAAYPLLAVAVGTGCRQGEILALAWDDIDLKSGALTVRHSLSETKQGFILKEPKSAAGRRTITLPSFVVDALVEHKAAALKAGLIAAPVFCSRTGNHLFKRNVLRSFWAAVQGANSQAAKLDGEEAEAKTIPNGLRFHDPRHTSASLLLSQGQSLRAVSQRLGHSNPALTLNVYAHCLPSGDAQLAVGLARMMASFRDWLQIGYKRDEKGPLGYPAARIVKYCGY